MYNLETCESISRGECGPGLEKVLYVTINVYFNLLLLICYNMECVAKSQIFFE